MKALYSLILSIVFIGFIGCNKNNTSSNTASTSIINKVNGTPIQLGKSYWLKNNDSIIIERLDYYISNITITNGQNSKSNNTLVLIKSENNKISINYSNETNPISSMNMTASLTTEQNNSNPTSFSASNPLSSSKNMYWSDWTKYRYVVFEGRILSSGQSKTFTFHTGLSYATNISINGNKTLSENNTIDLNIDKIFYPVSGNNINDSELITHSEVSQDAITKKFIQNFGSAFSF
jgi:hypothetical protein